MAQDHDTPPKAVCRGQAWGLRPSAFSQFCPQLSSAVTMFAKCPDTVTPFFWQGPQMPYSSIR